MMYIIYNHDGSIKEKNLTDFIQQGDNLTKSIAIAIEGYSPVAFSLIGTFTLPNNEKVVLTSDDTVTITDSKGNEYSGEELALTEEVTALAGVVRMNIQAVDTNDKVLTSYSTYLTINEGVSPDEIAMMSQKELHDLIALIEINVTPDETIIVMQTEPNSTEGFEVGQIAYYNYKFYKLIADGWSEIYDLTDHYTKAEINSFLATKQNLLTRDSLETAQLQYSVGFDAEGNLRKGAGGGGAVYTAGTGIEITDFTISVDTDEIATQDDLQNVREVAEGKCKAFVLSYQKALPTTDAQAQLLKKIDGSSFASLTEFNTYVADLTYYNPNFAYSYNSIGLTATSYIITDENIVIRSEDMDDVFGVGDVIYITELDVPDRWLSTSGGLWVCNKLETTKVDLTNYVTLNTNQDITAVKTIKDSELRFKNTSAGGNAEYTLEENIYGQLTISRIYNNIKTTMWYIDGRTFLPAANNSSDIGNSNIKIKDLFLSGALKNNNATYGLTLPDMTNWTANSEIVDTGSAQTIPGIKTFSNGVKTTSITADTNNDIKLKGYNNQEIFSASTSSIRFSTNVLPAYNQAIKLGLNTTTYIWDEAFVKKITDVNGSYSSDNVFNVINGSDVENRSGLYFLSQDQIATFRNGKPTLVRGFILSNYDYFFFHFDYSESWSYATGLSISDNLSVKIEAWQINSSTGQIIKNANLNFLTNRINGKNLPNFPTTNISSQVLAIGANGGNLSFDYLQNILYTFTASTTATELSYLTINTISVDTSNRTFTLQSAANTLKPEYKGTISNIGTTSVTLTFTGVSVIKTNDSNITITSNSLVLPGNTAIEFSIQNGNMIAFNWSAN